MTEISTAYPPGPTRSRNDPRDLAAALCVLLDEAGQSIERDIGRARDCLIEAKQLLRRHGGQAKLVTEPSGPGLAPWQRQRIIRYVENNLHEVIRTEDLAAIARLSVSHFSRAFRDSFDETPYAYVLGQRVARAKALMATSDDSLAQIALSCGMADQAHFSRLFRRLEGETPSRWRRRCQRNLQVA